jgi:hypothetical protein
VFKIGRSNPWPPDIDLATIRGTLRYMEDDMRRVPQFEAIAKALEDAIHEIDKAEAKSPPKIADRVVTHSRFIPFRRNSGA